MNKKEEAVFHLNTLTEQARRKTVDRRGFMKGAMALGLSATSAFVAIPGLRRGRSDGGSAHRDHGGARHWG